ncbi:MAG: hypothetical protein BWY19_00020 [bacterium ADurb.Bin212]|nr:MAG: hypothetical protein BWY19_00020 [bacterium ADurb.Bin212]
MKGVLYFSMPKWLAKAWREIFPPGVLDCFARGWRLVMAIVIVIFVLVVAALMSIVPADADEAAPLSLPMALTEMVRLHNAGLLLDITLSSEQYVGELLPDSSWRFRLEDGWRPCADGLARFVRLGGKLRAVELVPPSSVMARAGEVKPDTKLFRPSSLAVVSRQFASALVPESQPEQWSLGLCVGVPAEGKATILLHNSGQGRRLLLTLVGVLRGDQRKMEVAGFRIEEVESKPRLE